MNQGQELMREGHNGSFLTALGNQMFIAELQARAFGVAAAQAHWFSVARSVAFPRRMRPLFCVPALS